MANMKPTHTAVSVQNTAAVVPAGKPHAKVVSKKK